MPTWLGIESGGSRRNCLNIGRHSHPRVEEIECYPATEM